MEKPIEPMKETKISEKIQSGQMSSKLKSGSGKVIQKCKYCGKEFTTYACWVKRGEAKFCSGDCYHKFRSENSNEIRICP